MLIEDFDREYGQLGSIGVKIRCERYEALVAARAHDTLN